MTTEVRPPTMKETQSALAILQRCGIEVINDGTYDERMKAAATQVLLSVDVRLSGWHNQLRVRQMTALPLLINGAELYRDGTGFWPLLSSVEYVIGPHES